MEIIYKLRTILFLFKMSFNNKIFKEHKHGYIYLNYNLSMMKYIVKIYDSKFKFI